MDGVATNKKEYENFYYNGSNTRIVYGHQIKVGFEEYQTPTIDVKVEQTIDKDQIIKKRILGIPF